MSDDLDPGLRRLFAQTAEHPADEAFVSAVTARTSRDGKLAMAAWSLVAALAAVVTLGALGFVLEQTARLITPLLTASPAGYAYGLGLAIAGAVCVRLFAPLVSRRT